MKDRIRRAVPLDEAAFAAVCQRIVDALAAMCAALPPLPLDRFVERAVDLRVVDAPELRNVTNVRGQTLDVLVIAEILFRPKARLLSGFATLRQRRSSWVEVHVQWNAAHTNETVELAHAPGLYEHRICSIFRHELTHARDVIREEDVTYPNAGYRYYNSPHEVRAFMAQILDEVTRPGTVREAKRRAALSRTPNRTLVEVALEKSPTWQHLSEEWIDANKKLVLKNVAATLAPYMHAYPKPPLR